MSVLRDICDSCSDLIQKVSLDERFLYVNPTWRNSLGFSSREVSRLVLFDVVHPEDKGEFKKTYRRLLEKQAPVHLSVRLRGKDGREVEVEGDAFCQLRKGRVVSTYGLLRDVGIIRRAAEDQVRLFDLSLDLLCVAGVDSYFKQVNPAFTRALGYSREELLSRSFMEFVHPDDRASTLREVERLAQGYAVVDFQNRYLARDGSYRWLAWRSAPWAEKGLIYAVARDITEQKRTEETMIRQAEELARSNADLEQFAYVASHDLRSPLRSLATLATWIEEDMPGQLPQQVERHLERLRGMVSRMEKLTDDILQYSRAGRHSDRIVRVDTAELMQELVQLLSPPEDLVVRWDPGLPVFETARSRLEQVFRNLLSNAIKHREHPGGTVTIAAEERPDCYEFSVSDDGPGISPGDHEQIFSMFYKLPSSRSSEGSGIGLALVKRIVESHGGHVWVESAEGRGATFRFTWPKANRTAEASLGNHTDR